MMNEKQLDVVKETISEKIGINVEGFVNPAEPRKGLSFWFDNFTRSNGPVFSIRPSGLKRHIVSIKFGAYASTCIEHIKIHASEETYDLAYAFIEQLDNKYDIKLNGNPVKKNWRVDTGFNIEISRKDVEQNSTETIGETVELIMIPLMAAVAELIGTEEIEEEEVKGEEEGNLIQTVVTKRERSPRNRLLCFAIHGEVCCICGIDPKSLYGEEIGRILEIHHIEPLSEIEKARVYNPRTDLIPLCPNCHRAIHKRKPAYRPDELKDLLIK